MEYEVQMQSQLWQTQSSV